MLTAEEIAKEMNKEKMACIKPYTTKEVSITLTDMQLVPLAAKKPTTHWESVPPTVCFGLDQVSTIKKKVKRRRVFKNNARIRFQRTHSEVLE